MTPFDYRQSYRRKLPHLHNPGSTIFTTFRLVGSVPATLINQYKKDRLSKLRQAGERSDSQAAADFYREWFAKIEAVLDRAAEAPTWLGRPALRSIVYEKILEGDSEDYRLDAFSIMCNHAHVVFQPNLDEDTAIVTPTGEASEVDRDQATLAKIMQLWKGGSARECNRLLGRTGQFWDHESFDREIRADGFIRAVRYTLRNPVKAGLVQRPMDWPGNYISQRLLEEPWARELWTGTENKL